MGKARIIFITGTGTGVGKTVLMSLLLVHLRASGCSALGIKPFCSGSRRDVCLLRRAQDRQLTEKEINPFFFPEPVAPLVAARKHRRAIVPREVLAHVADIAGRCECLLVEGAGGLLVPLAEGFTTLDLIVGLCCDVIVVSRNKLGTINHTLLTVQALQVAGIRYSPRSSGAPALLNTVLMDHRVHDPSCASNAGILREILRPLPLIGVPFLGRHCCSADALKANQKKIKKTLARILR
jgi:dethiobiotin synthetase